MYVVMMEKVGTPFATFATEIFSLSFSLSLRFSFGLLNSKIFDS